MRSLALAAALFCAGPAAAQGGKPTPRPNVLVLIADDWSARHAGCYGDKVVTTPNIDRLARAGVLFRRAYTVAPSCTPSRAAILTGQWVHRLQESGNLWSILRDTYLTYPDLLERAGYFVGMTRKGWGPGSLEGSGRTRNPAGPQFKTFADFLKKRPKDRPFCFWFGSQDPHRPYDPGSGAKAGLSAKDVTVPPYWPDTPEVRNDVLDYYLEVQRFDREVGEILQLLADAGLDENTIILVLSDNGMPFPRSKANLYGLGTHMPLIVRWPAQVKGGRESGAFISYQDIAPTLLEAVGIKAPAGTTGKSFLGILTKGEEQAWRDHVFVERERHANVRKGDLSYPSRAVRTEKFLYVRNFRPDLWPAGDPERWFAVGPYGDIDGGPTKDAVVALRGGAKDGHRMWELCCGKRPAEELYDLTNDPWEMNNVADRAEYAREKAKLRGMLEKWMRDTGDPRAEKGGDDDRWDKFPYFGKPGGGKGKEKKGVLSGSALVDALVVDVRLDGARHEVANRAARRGAGAQVAAGDVDQRRLDRLDAQRRAGGHVELPLQLLLREHP